VGANGMAACSVAGNSNGIGNIAAGGVTSEESGARIADKKKRLLRSAWAAFSVPTACPLYC